MNLTRMALRSFFHFWRSNLTIAIGVAAATAVLTGALIVGDSMRGSLKQLTFDRLADVDEVFTGRSYFREDLAKELTSSAAFQDSYDLAVPVVMLPNASAERGDGDDRVQVVSVSVFGCNEDFWKLDATSHLQNTKIGEDEIVINRTLADSLGIQELDPDEPIEIGVRLPIQGRVPGESPLGKKEQQAEFVSELTVVAIIDDIGLGRFSMHPSQLPPRNAFMSLEQLQDVLSQDQTKNKTDARQANVILVSGKDSRNPPGEEISKKLTQSIRPSLEDFDLRIQRVTQKFDNETVFDYYSISSDQMIMSDPMAEVIQKTLPDAQPVMTYLANRMLVSSRDTQKRPIPFSMVSAIEFNQQFAPLSAITGKPIQSIGDDEIILNSWTAEKLGAKPNDMIEVTFFEPETTDGDEVEKTVKFKLVDVARVTMPEREVDHPDPFPFTVRPTLANDPSLTPYVPGLTDADSVNDWDLPFETPGIEKDDDTYWKLFRTTPKAFVSLSTGRKYWASRFGKTTSFRIPIADRDTDSLKQTVSNAIADAEQSLGFELIPVKRQGLKASSGTTPFDVLFLSLSMFVIVAALILVSILFRLSLQNRANQIGILSAAGWAHGSIIKVWILEMLLVALTGAVLGIGLGLGYAALMILGLRTWWVGAISTPFIQLHTGWLSFVIGALAGTLVCLVTILFSVWHTRKLPVRGLLSGKIESERQRGSTGKRSATIAIVLLVVAVLLAGLATQLGGESQAGAFLGGGFCILAAMLTWVWNRFGHKSSSGNHQHGLSRLAAQSLSRNPLRSVLTIGLVASASFLIVAISAFRLAPSNEGTAGFQWVATTEQPIFEDLNNSDVQEKLFGVKLDASSFALPLRLKSGQDASCNNPYQSTQPRVLGVSENFILVCVHSYTRETQVKTPNPARAQLSAANIHCVLISSCFAS